MGHKVPSPFSVLTEREQLSQQVILARYPIEESLGVPVPVDLHHFVSITGGLR